MKKLCTLALITLTIFSCSKKMTPAKSMATTSPATMDSTASANSSNASNVVMVTAGQAVYVAKCGKCHGLKDPANYTQERWVGLVNAMAPRAKATDEEKGQILAYVQHNAKDAPKS